MADASKELYEKFRSAQGMNNADASVAYKKAIELAGKGKTADAAWWEQQGDMAMPTPVQESV